VKRPESAVQPTPAGSGLQSPSVRGVGEGARALGGFDDTPACAGRPPLWDYDAGEFANDQAKAVCSTCPMRRPCLAIGVRDKLDGVWGGVSLLNGMPHVVRLSGMSVHRHRLNGEPLCDACIDLEAATWRRRREADRVRREAKKAGAA
jgi:Transcription factor WhiB